MTECQFQITQNLDNLTIRLQHWWIPAQIFTILINFSFRECLLALRHRNWDDSNPMHKKEYESSVRYGSALFNIIVSLLPPRVLKMAEHVGFDGDRVSLWLTTKSSWQCEAFLYAISRVFNDLIDDFTKSDFKSFWDDFEIFEILWKYGDLICDLILKMSMKIKSQII
jgi:hypothetical protein